MKKIMFFKFFFIIFFYSFSCFSLTLEKMNVELNYPWGMTWIDSTNLLITEKKSKEIILFNVQSNTSSKIKHEIPVAALGQGGLLDIVSEGNTIWITCSIHKEGLLTTAIFKSRLENNTLIDTQLIFQALDHFLHSKIWLQLPSFVAKLCLPLQLFLKQGHKMLY